MSEEDSVSTPRSMSAEDVASLYSELDSMGIKVWIDGGWAVDALLGEQTRPHGDLDIAIERKDAPKLKQLLENRRYQIIPRDDLSDWNYHLGDETHEVDVHIFMEDAQTEDEKFYSYPEGSLTGTGVVNGIKVRCVDPEFLVRFHTGYELRETDYHDVIKLCEKFGIDYPAEYAHLKPSSE